MRAEVAAQQDCVPGRDARRQNRRALDHADARRVDVHAVALASFDDLRVSSDDGHAGSRRGLAHRCHNALQRFDGKTFFEDEAGAQRQRARAAHRQVVHRPVDRQLADRSAGEEQRPHHVGVGGECQTARGGLDRRAVVPCRQRRIAEGRVEHFFQQLLRHAHAAAVRQHDLSAALRGARADQRRQARFVLAHRRGLTLSARSGSTPRRRPRSKPSARPAAAPACTASRRPGTRAASSALAKSTR